MTNKTQVLSIGVALLAICSVCSAGQINGSIALAGIGVSEDGTDLSNSTLISTTFDLTTGAGVGDLAPIPLGTEFDAAPLDLTNFNSYSLSNAVWGSFTTTSGQVTGQTASDLEVFLLGTFTPGPGLPGTDATVTSLRISVNQSGSSVSEAITLNSPAILLAPEPMTLTMLGCSLAFLGICKRRRILGNQ